MTFDVSNSDPIARKVAQGFPPPRERQPRFEDSSHYMFPNSRWSFSHMREFIPTISVWRGPAAPSALPQAARHDLDEVAFTTLDGRPTTWAQGLADLCVDGVIILHRGRVLYERYFGALEAHRPHAAFSVTKSFVGLLGAMLAHEGKIDASAAVTRYVPEMAATAYGNATVRQVMDMTIGVKYSETYADPSAEIWDYARAAGSMARPVGYAGPDTITDFLVRLQPEGAHGEAFAYKTCNTEVLGWIVQRASGQNLAHLISERLWRKLGCEENADLAVDRAGMAMSGGGLSLTLRDMARFGEMMRLGGRFNGHEIVPEAVVADIARGADPAHFSKAGILTLPGASYRHQWWTLHDKFNAFMARGIHGQAIWIAPKAEMTIARFASHPWASNANSVLDHVSMPGYAAIAEHVLATV
jgi:CubicO group peptidase (beta-lactamase class C family)